MLLCLHAEDILLHIKRGKNSEFKSQFQEKYFGGVLKSMLTLNEAIIDVKEG